MTTPTPDLTRQISESKMAKQLKSVVSMILDVTAFIIAFVLFLVLEFVLTRLVDPVFRGFYCNDESIRYPYQDHPAVPTWALAVFDVLVPLAVVRKRSCSRVSKYVHQE